MDVKEKKKIKKIKDDLYKETQRQRKQAWQEKDYKNAYKLRKKEQESYEKWKFYKGFLNELEKENED